jgi:hypothetical protein
MVLVCMMQPWRATCPITYKLVNASYDSIAIRGVVTVSLMFNSEYVIFVRQFVRFLNDAIDSKPSGPI